MVGDNIQLTQKSKRISSICKKLGIKNSNNKVDDEEKKDNKLSRINHLNMIKHTPNRCIRGCSSYYGCCCSKGGKKLASIFGDSPPRHTYMSLPEFAKLTKANPIYQEYTLLNQSTSDDGVKDIKDSKGNSKILKKWFKKPIKYYNRPRKIEVDKKRPSICKEEEEKTFVEDKNLDKYCTEESSIIEDNNTNYRELDNLSRQNIRRHSVASSKECHLKRKSILKKLNETYNNCESKGKVDKPYFSGCEINRRVSLTPNILLSTPQSNTQSSSINNCRNFSISAGSNFLLNRANNSSMPIGKNNINNNGKKCDTGKRRLFKATASSLSLFSNGYLSDAFSSVTANFSGSITPDLCHSRASSIVTELPSSSTNKNEDNTVKKKDSVTNRCKFF
uniref:Homeobox protein 2-like n=1 Tax=Parastrongyloides trichosuri TaxID=131310 RepID=A0A0N4ZME6_PARTI